VRGVVVMKMGSGQSGGGRRGTEADGTRVGAEIEEARSGEDEKGEKEGNNEGNKPRSIRGAGISTSRRKQEETSSGHWCVLDLTHLRWRKEVLIEALIISVWEISSGELGRGGVTERDCNEPDLRRGKTGAKAGLPRLKLTKLRKLNRVRSGYRSEMQPCGGVQQNTTAEDR
jgi:hypothetical protein